jgi:DNA-binding winged helix-turn-helix (wHTH) protein
VTDYKTSVQRAPVYRLSEFQRRAPSSEVADGRTVTVRMTMTTAGGARLFKYLAERGDCILLSPDGGLSIRVRVALETAQITEEQFAEGALVIDWLASTVSHGRRRTSLSRTELRLLEALLEGAGNPVPRARLIERAWPGCEMTGADKGNDLAVYIYALRKQLARVGLADVLRTVRGTGYALVVDQIVPPRARRENGSSRKASRSRRSSRR